MSRNLSARPHPLKAYVSASSRGVGFEIARQLAQEGANVALSSRDSSHLDAARSTILAEAPDVQVLTAPGNLAYAADQERILATLDAHDFAPDVFVCGTGHPKNRYLSSLSRTDWESDMEMVLGQAVFATQKFAPAMAERGFGRLIFLSSIYAKTPQRDYFMSSLARSGLFALSKMVGDEYANRGVASFVVCLGFIDTPMVRNLAIGRPQDAPAPEATEAEAWGAKYDEWAVDIPAKRIASPTELAKFIAFLTTPEAEYLNGTVFSFSGGLDRALV